MNTQYEDERRYTAPPDNDPEELKYSTSEILAYIESWIPGYPSDTYTLNAVHDILQAAVDRLTDEEYGINTI